MPIFVVLLKTEFLPIKSQHSYRVHLPSIFRDFFVSKVTATKKIRAVEQLSGKVLDNALIT